jgi:Flp pilus assembly pilin Flp
MATEPKVKPKSRETSRLTPCGQETIMDLIIKFTCDEAGASAVEYAFLLAFIAVAIAAGVTTFGKAVGGLFDNVVAQLPGS